MQVRDLMTVRVVCVSPEMSLHDVAHLFLDRHISGAPVLDDDRVIGIVTKTDLIRGEEEGRGAVNEVMTTDVIVLTEKMPVTEATRVMFRHDVNRAPVVRGDRLVGFVTRSDLLRPHLRTDDEILADIEHGVLSGALGLSPRVMVVRVLDGVVFLEGPVRDEQQHTMLRRLVVAVPGVVDVVDHTQVAPMALARLEAERSGAPTRTA